MLDLDHFKRINDQFGHGKGDEVLAAVGAEIVDCLRASDFAGRFGGEEFLILLPDTNVAGAEQVAEKIRTTVAAITVPGVDREVRWLASGFGDMRSHDDRLGCARLVDEKHPTAGRARDRLNAFGRRRPLRPRAERPLQLRKKRRHCHIAGDDDRRVVGMEPITMPLDEVVAGE